MHIFIGNLTMNGSDIGLSPIRCQTIIWSNAGILLIGPLGTNFSEILIKIHAFLFKKMHLKLLSAKWWPFYLGLNPTIYPIMKYASINAKVSDGYTTRIPPGAQTWRICSLSIICLNIKFHQSFKPQHLCQDFIICFEIWQHRCHDACQILKQSENFIIQKS